MTVKEIYDKLETFGDDDRAKYAGALCGKLSPTSMQTMFEFQDTWDGNKTPKEFFEAQAKKIKMCVDLEIGPMRQTIRQIAGLKALTWETEIAAQLFRNKNKWLSGEVV